MKGRRFAAVLIVLSMLLMLVPAQAFAEEETAAETVSESAVPETETAMKENDLNKDDAGQEQALFGTQEEPAASDDEITAEEISEGEEDVLQESETEAEEVTEQTEAASEAETKAEVEETAVEETEQKEASLEEETDPDAVLSQMAFSGSSSDVTWSDASSELDANGIRTVSFNASIPEGTTASELNLNVLDTPNLAALAFSPDLGETVKYVVNVTDATGSYQFKESSGAVALADSSWNISSSVSESLAKATMLSADGSGYQGADTYLTSAGEGNGFSSVLQAQWAKDQKEQQLSYYQQMQNAESAAVSYPVVQFKLTHTDVPAVTETAAEESGELFGTVPLSVKKVLTGQTLKADQFTFELKDENGNVLQTKKNAQDGTIPFDSLEFTGNDIGEHKYTINEVMPEGAKADSNGKIVVDHIEYDTHTESVTITISLNDEGKLKATVRQSTTELTFTNKYTETSSTTTTTSRTSPRTGDSSPIMPYISMLAGAGIALVMIKRMLRVHVRR